MRGEIRAPARHLGENVALEAEAVNWLVMEPRTNVRIRAILNWVVELVVMILHELVTLFKQGMSGFVV